MTSAVVVAFDPLKVNTVPLPRDAGLILPEILQVGLAVAAKFTAGGLAPLIVAD